MLRIVTIVNKIDVFEFGIKRTLSEQVCKDWSLLQIDNTDSQYSSLYKAYSSILYKNENIYKSDFIMICHPDIFFTFPKELGRLYNCVSEIYKKNSNIGIVGVAGAKNGKNHIGVSTIVHGKDKRGNPCPEFNDHQYIEVQTVDPCCFFVRSDILKQFEFDKENNTFHMLIEEYCLRLKENDIISVVIPANLWHFSAGASLDYHYYLETKRIAKKYGNLEYINTTSFHWDNNWKLPLKLDYYAFRNYIHHKLIRR